MAIWHLGFSSTKRGTLFPDEAQRRVAVHALARVTGDRLALFSFVHEHKHAMVREGDGSIKALSTKMQRSLSAVSEEPLNTPWIERVDGTRHKEKLLHYFLTQPSHHEVGVSDALWTGSCFLDLAGARVIHGLRLCIWDLLPNTSRGLIYKHVGLPLTGVEPVTLAEIRVLGAVRLVAAASAALAADPLLRGRSDLVRRARGLAMELGRQARIPPGEVRWALRMPKTCFHRLPKQSVAAGELLAVRRRLALEEAVVKATGGIAGLELGRRLGLGG